MYAYEGFVRTLDADLNRLIREKMYMYRQDAGGFCSLLKIISYGVVGAAPNVFLRGWFLGVRARGDERRGSDRF